MADEYVYCHGTDVIKNIQDRIRGVKGSKVLRTKKIKRVIIIITCINIFVVSVVMMISQTQTYNKKYCDCTQNRASGNTD